MRSSSPQSGTFETHTDAESSLTMNSICSHLLRHSSNKKFEASLALRIQYDSMPEIPGWIKTSFQHSTPTPQEPPAAHAVDDPFYACDILDLELIEQLVSRTSRNGLLSVDADGLSHIARVIRSDDPLVETIRRNRYPDGYFKEQEKAMSIILNRTKGAKFCTKGGDNVVTFAARHGSLHALKFLLSTSYEFNMREDLITEIIALDGTRWTPLRAAIVRQESAILKYLLREIGAAGLENEKNKRFEKDFSYLHLCAFLEGGWSKTVAELLIDKQFKVNLVAKDPISNMQWTPYTLAIMKGNLKLANYLLLEKCADPYISVIRPSIRPPPDLIAWVETAIIPQREQKIQTGIRGYFAGLKGLYRLEQGGYTEKELEDELQGNGSRVWTMTRWKFGIFPLIMYKKCRLQSKFLVEFGLQAGYRGPFMDGWLQYRTILDHMIILGHKRIATEIAESLVANRDYSIVERAIGTGICYLYQSQRRTSDDMIQTDSESDNHQRRVNRAIEDIIKILMKKLDTGSAMETPKFFTREIQIDEKARVDSYFPGFRFIFGLSPECVTSLCHLAIIGGLDDIVGEFSRPAMEMIRDGGKKSPLERAQMELLFEKRKPEEKPSPIDGKTRLMRLQTIVNHLENVNSTDTVLVRHFGLDRKTMDFLMYTVGFSLIQFIPIRIMWSFEKEVCNKVNHWFFFAVAFVAGLMILFVFSLNFIFRLPQFGQSLELGSRRRHFEEFLIPVL